MRGLALLLAVVACKSSPPASPVVQGRAERPAAGPAPAVAWRDGAFALERLPAVTEDGAEVLLAISDRDGARGNANLRYELRDRSDRTVTQHEVLAVADGDAMFGPDGPTDELKTRIATGNGWLAELHARRRLVPLRALQVTQARIAERAIAESAGVRLSIDRARLRIERDGQRLLDRQTPEAWSQVPDRQATRCAQELQLAGAEIDVERRVAVVTLAVAAGDLCDTPADRHAVVAW